MKIALCLSGSPREFKSSYESLCKFIIEPLKPDIFISTWDWRQDLEHEGRNNTKDEGNWNEMYNFFCPKLMEIEVWDKQTEESIGITRLLKKHNINFLARTPAMWYKIFKAYQLMLGYSLINDIEYDIVIRARPDLVYFNEIPIEELNNVVNNENKNLIYIRRDIINPVTQCKDFIHDIFSFGSMQGMAAYSYGVFKVLECYEKANPKTPEMMLLENLRMKHTEIKSTKCRQKLCREPHGYDEKENKIILR